MKEYKDLITHVLYNGQDVYHERTKIGVRKTFGYQMRFNLEEGFPLVSIKQTGWKTILSELIWFLQGNTNNNWLKDHNVSIWNEWAPEDGDLGPIYGKQWRDFGGVDQIKQVLESLRKDPHGRRHIVSAWNPPEIPRMALPPCHAFFQFYVSNDNRLSCQLYQRSADILLGVPYNIASYSMLIHIFAKILGYRVGEFVHTLGDAHLYHNQMNENFYKLLNRQPVEKKPEFRVPYYLNDIDQLIEEKITVKDFAMNNYTHRGKLEFPVAV